MLDSIKSKNYTLYNHLANSVYLVRLVLGAICCTSIALLLLVTPTKADRLVQVSQIPPVEFKCYTDPAGVQPPIGTLAVEIDQGNRLQQFKSLESISSSQPLSSEMQDEFNTIRTIRSIKQRRVQMVRYIRQYCPFSIVLQEKINVLQPIASNIQQSYRIYNYKSKITSTLNQRNKVMLNKLANLVIFDIVASVEWEPAVEGNSFLQISSDLASLNTSCHLRDTISMDTPPYIKELFYSLCKTSRLIYKATHGQAVLGKVKIYTNGERWNEADIRIHANNTERPAALLRGVKLDTGPSAVWLGRCWNGVDASCFKEYYQVNWSQDNGVGTMAHELSHYLFGLADEYYMNTDVGPISAQCPVSMMWSHYEGDPQSYWDVDTNDNPLCYQTEHFRLYSKDGKSIIQASYPNLDTSLVANDDDMAAVNALFQPSYEAENSNTFEPALDLALNPSITIPVNQIETSRSDIYSVYPSTFKQNDIKQVIAQGTTGHPKTDIISINNLDEALILGATHDNTRIHATVTTYPTCEQSGQRFVYPALRKKPAMLVEGVNTIILSEDQWLPTLKFDMEVSASGFDKVTVELTSQMPAQSAKAQLCTPDVGCSPSKPFSSSGDATFVPSDLNLSEIPSYTVMRVYSQQGEAYSTIRYLGELGNLGAANMWAHAKSMDGDVMVTALTEHEVDGHVFITSIVNSEMLQMPLDCNSNNIKRVIEPLGNAYVFSKEPIKSPIALQWFYDKEALKRLEVEESRLGLLYFNTEEKGSWEVIRTLQREDIQGNEQHNQDGSLGEGTTNWLSTGPIDHDGIFMLVEMAE